MRQSLSAVAEDDDDPTSWPDYDSFRPLALRMLLPMGLRYEDCEDLVQQVLLEGFLRRDRIYHPLRWLAVKLRRDAWRLVARNRRSLSLPPDELTALIDRRASVQPPLARVEANRILARLPPRPAILLTLLYRQGLSDPETATALGLSPNSIKKLRTRALAVARGLAATRTTCDGVPLVVYPPCRGATRLASR